MARSTSQFDFTLCPILLSPSSFQMLELGSRDLQPAILLFIPLNSLLNLTRFRFFYVYVQILWQNHTFLPYPFITNKQTLEQRGFAQRGSTYTWMFSTWSVVVRIHGCETTDTEDFCVNCVLYTDFSIVWRVGVPIPVLF